MRGKKNTQKGAETNEGLSLSVAWKREGQKQKKEKSNKTGGSQFDVDGKLESA